MPRLFAWLLVLTLVLAPACAKASAQERVAQSAIKTSDAGSARMSMKMDSQRGAQQISMTAEGAIDFKTQKLAMTMDLGAMGQQAGMTQLEVRSGGTTFYMKFPNYQQIGMPTPWVKVDLTALAGVPGMESLSQLNNNDPSKTMQMLRGVSDNVVQVGAEEVRGAPTTHYKASIDVDKALEEVPQESRESLQRIFEQAGAKTVPTEVWLDQEGLLRRQKITMDFSNAKGTAAAGGQAPTGMVIDLQLYDFGTDIDVEPPPADQVTDFKQLQRDAGG